MMSRYYFIGIKGTGMAALAILLNDLGNEVSGCDLEKHFFTENGLIERNIKIQLGLLVAAQIVQVFIPCNIFCIL